MKKLRLDLDALAVQSFDTGASFGRGTVAGNRIDVQPFPIEPKESQSNCEGCHYTLIPTCLNSCGDHVCTIASQTECPSCYQSCNGCGPTCACPAEPQPIGGIGGIGGARG